MKNIGFTLKLILLILTLAACNSAPSSSIEQNIPDAIVETEVFNGCFESGTQGAMKINGVQDGVSVFISDTKLEYHEVTVAFLSGGRYTVMPGDYLYIGEMKTNIKLVTAQGQIGVGGTYEGTICMKLDE